MEFSFSVPGKVILFGEHSVVYGSAAVASAISLRMRLTGKLTKGKRKGIRVNFADDHRDSLELVQETLFKHLGDDEELELEFISEIPEGRGMGSSAAFCALVAAAEAKLKAEDIDKQELIRRATELERRFHKNPSGIDPATVILGGAVYMKNREITPIEVQAEDILAVDTGVKRSTAKAVEHVRMLKEKIMPQIQKLGDLADEYIAGGSLIELMPIAGSILNSIGLGCPESEAIERLAKENSLSSKISGAGMGGIVIVAGADVHRKSSLFSPFNVFPIKICAEGFK